jgi:hypothetical protein
MSHRACRKRRRWFNPNRQFSGWSRYAARFPERANFYQSGLEAGSLGATGPRAELPAQRGEGQRRRSHRVIAEGGADLDLANLQSLCKRHHGRKSLDESHRGMKRAAQRRRKQ